MIDSAAQTPGSITFEHPHESHTLSWAQLRLDALAMAARLQAEGLQPGQHVCVLGPTNRGVVTAVQAIWQAGCAVVMLPLPMRLGSIEAFIEQTRRRIADADGAYVLIDPEFAPFVQPAPGDPPFFRLDEISGEATGLTAGDAQEVKIASSDRAILQFTSGSTADPKGVDLSHFALTSNIAGAAAAGGLVSEDVVVSWLPLYHDMGLVGMLSIPMCSPDVSLVLGAPQDFLAKPLRWLQWISDYDGSVTAAPNFAYALATRALRKAPDDLDLSSMKVLLSGAEPVDGPTFRKFLDAAGRYGLRPESAFPAFGMAEVCIGGTFPRRGQGLRMDVVDRVALEAEHLAVEVDPESPDARELAVLGTPLPGLEMRIVDPSTGEDLGDRQVGELLIAGTSLTSGYYKNPTATAELLRDGWLHTGDLAYSLNGELVLCGRIKDVIIIGGRNIYPQDVERAVNAVEGVRAGNTIAFGIDGRAGAQQIVVVSETREAPSDELVTAISEAVTAEIGVPAREVVLVEPGSIPKTSSGKLQRSGCKRAWEQGELARITR
jgi:fatty-acyl-CoA synthase